MLRYFKDRISKLLNFIPLKLEGERWDVGWNGMESIPSIEH